MRFAALSAWKDLTRILRDPLGLFAWVAMPVIITGLLAVMFGRSNTPPLPHGTLLLDDEDRTLVSAGFVDVFSRNPFRKMITVQSMGYEQGRNRMDAGAASALLIIPKGFARAFFSGEHATLTLITNPSQRLLPGMIREALSTELDGSFYLQRLAGPQLAFFGSRIQQNTGSAPGGPAKDLIPRQLSNYFNPPLMELRTTVVESKRQQVSLAVLFYPGMLILAIFGMAQSLSEDIWRERSYGTLRRLLAGPRSLSSFMGGKIAALALLFACVGMAGMLIARLALSAEIHNAALAILWIALSGVGLYLMASLLQAFASEQRAGTILNAFVLFLFSMMGGTIFPFEMMPNWLVAIGRFTPNGWAVRCFKDMISDSLDASRLAFNFTLLLLLVAIGFLFLSRRLRRWAV